MRLLPLLALPLLLGCRNACQQLCKEMADFASDSCGLEFSRSEIRACVRDHGYGDVDADEREICAYSIDRIEEEWTCDDLEDYFKDAGSET